MRAAAVTIVLGIVVSALACNATPSSSRAASLQRAFEAELDSAAMFSAFAGRADQERLPGVASLFRALALAEEIHARKHADVMGSPGARPRAAITEVDVKSTRENLQAAILRELFDMQALYPTLLDDAQAIGERTTLGLALLVERTHVKLLDQALNALDASGDAAGELCVQQRTGYVSRCHGATTVARAPSADRNVDPAPMTTE